MKNDKSIEKTLQIENFETSKIENSIEKTENFKETIDKNEILDDQNPSSVYVSDFESDSGSELIEKYKQQTKLSNFPLVNFDNKSSVLTEKTEDYLVEKSMQKERKIVNPSIEKISSSIENLSNKIYSIEKKPDFAILNHEFPENIEIYDEIESGKINISDEKQFNPTVIKKRIKEPKPLTELKNDPEKPKKLFENTDHPLMSKIQNEISRIKQSFIETEAEKQEKRSKCLMTLLDSLQSKLNPPTAVRLKKKSETSDSQTPTITIESLKEAKRLGVQQKPEDEQTLNNTPSFSDKEIYDNFNTFGSNIKSPELKTVENLIFPKKDEENIYDMILIENDTETTKSNKLKKWEDKKFKRIEELEKRQIKKNFSPDRITPVEKIKFHPSPQSSPKPSPKPIHKAEMRNSPKPSNRPREDVKNGEEKYKRHKNLPNLVYNKPSNRKIITNAIASVCLAGDANRNHREEVLAIVNEYKEISFFIIVFTELGRRDLRGLYSHDPNTSEVLKIYGPGYLPESLDASVVNGYFRYDSGAKEFKPLQCKDFIVATDAVCLKKFHKVYES